MDLLREKFLEFQSGHEDLDDVNKIHRIMPHEFEQEGYFMILCTQSPYEEICEIDIEIWKVYKTEKYYHVLEFCQPLRLDRKPTYKFNIYNYYDYERVQEPYPLWRNSTEILGYKLPDNFEL